jgi:hypothetical protein
MLDCGAYHKLVVVCIMHMVTFYMYNKFEGKMLTGTSVSWIKWHFPPNVRWMMTFSDVALSI